MSMFGSGSVILRGSPDRNARLWTTEGKLVPGLVHQKKWSLRKPSVYTTSRCCTPVPKTVGLTGWGVGSRNLTTSKILRVKNNVVEEYRRNPWSHIRGDRNKKKRAFATLPVLEEGQLFNVNEPLKSEEKETIEPTKHGSCGADAAKDSKLEAKGQQEPEPQLPRIDCPQQASPNQAPSEDTAQSRLKTPPLSSVLGQRKHESFFKHNLEEEFLQRIARRTVRRHLFGEINPNKVNRFGIGCSPFHALATTEMETFTLPSNLPMTARMLSKGMVCTSESDLKSMQLTFPELDEVSAEEPKANDRKKPPDQTKKAKLPPLVKLSRSRLSENKKTSGCRLPSVPAVIASISLKWGKF